jgi:hypothetical protein
MKPIPLDPSPNTLKFISYFLSSPAGVAVHISQLFTIWASHFISVSIFWNLQKSSGSAVGIVIGCGLDDRGFGVRVPVGSRVFASPYRQDRIWGLLNLLSNRFRGHFPRC